MTRDRQVYLLDPQKLPPETIAVTFAKTSRSPQSFLQIASELTNEKSADFHEKWVVGYGHSSVAEHAVLHIAVENASRLAVECIESNRLASYTEKSTRYQTWDSEAFYHPTEWMGTAFETDFLSICHDLFDAYAHFLPVIQRTAAELYPKNEDESPAGHERRVHSLAVDVCRFLLPASSLANVGITINARSLEHAIGKMLSSPLAEVREIGSEIKTAAIQSVPTLLKYANEIPYLKNSAEVFSHPQTREQDTEWCQLVSADTDAVEKILAAVYYRFSPDAHSNYQSAREYVNNVPMPEKVKALQLLLCERDAHTIPLREVEHTSFMFDAFLDQGAYYELKRHRMMTLTPQLLTANLGYAIPLLVEQAGLRDPYRKIMDRVKEVYGELAKKDPQAAAYIIPNAFNRRFLITCNLRSLIHFIALRSAPNAHFSIRRLAQRMAEEVRRVSPVLGECIPRCTDETSSSIEVNYFSSTIEV